MYINIIFVQILKPELVSDYLSSWQSDFSYNHGKTHSSVSGIGKTILSLFFSYSFFFQNGAHTVLLKGQEIKLLFISIRYLSLSATDWLLFPPILIKLLFHHYK